jgi:hypothetical protein
MLLSGRRTQDKGQAILIARLAILKLTVLMEVQMRIGSVILLVWLVIGGFAAGQRGDYQGSMGNCSRAGTIAVTVLAGPLNYAGVNPNINCTVPQPSS